MTEFIEYPKVSISCLVYNHENFLRECLDGFVMQKTNFRFEAIVHDDASTDRSADIIREYAEKYPDIIKPIYETENQYSKHDGSLKRVMINSLKGKYIAFCEGDDYWTDPYKLQKQVDYMESHEDVTMVFTAFDVVDQYSNKLPLGKFEDFQKQSFGDWHFFDLLINNNYILTLTTLFRKGIYESCPHYYFDYGYFLRAARLGKLHFIEDVTGCYRQNPNSIMHTCPESLIGRKYKTFLNEIEQFLKESNNTTNVYLLNHKRSKLYIAYALRRYFFHTPEKFSFALVMFKAPNLWFAFLKACIIRRFLEDEFIGFVKHKNM